MDKISERINFLMDSKGINQAKLAKKLGIATSSVSNFCNGKTKPSNQTITLICREFHISENWLRTGEGEMLIDDKLSAYDSDDPMIQSFINAYMELDDTSRQALKKLVLSAAEKYKEKEQKKKG